jgi:CRISPR/Cas system CSM-associated protein Csm4 (group 5 of RAMP superfamily)
MEYSLYRLNFTTCLHIGRDTGAVSLDSSRMAIHADTLFAALCCEAAGDERLGKLVEYFTEGTLAISDAWTCSSRLFSGSRLPVPCGWPPSHWIRGYREAPGHP